MNQPYPLNMPHGRPARNDSERAIADAFMAELRGTAVCRCETPELDEHEQDSRLRCRRSVS